LSVSRVKNALRVFAAVVVGGLAAACGGGGGGSAALPAPSPPPPPGPTVTISGKITYDYVPHSPTTGGLAYAQTQARPARRVTVQFVEGTNPLATANTDLDGNYSVTVPANRTGFIRALAWSLHGGAPSWSFNVVDNTSNNRQYTLDGAPLTSGDVNSVRNLHAPSGWTGSGYGAERAAAPFAILDTIQTAAAYVAAADPTIAFPQLNIHWSPDNIDSFGADGVPDPLTGELGTSFYGANATANGIYLLGEENQDSDEYDEHVIVHEFGHYLEHRFGRGENLGGPHGRGDRLDPRVAFSEGWPTAVAGLALGNPAYRDAGGTQQQGATGFNIERPPAGFANPTPGWYSEQSVWELVYDLVDAAVDGNDTVAYPFAEVWAALKNAMPASKALPTLFPFWRAMKEARPGDQVVLDQLTSAQFISPIADHYGTGETNSGGSAHVLPIYSPITLNGPAVNLCSTNEFVSGQSGAVNKLGSRRFLRFSSSISSTVTVTVTATSIPAGEFSDPDFLLHRGQLVASSTFAPSAACQANATGGGVPSSCTETSTIPSPVDDYVLEIYEWTNTNDTDDPDYPPIGTTCFDIRVTQP
jgi:hypothetical protein